MFSRKSMGTLYAAEHRHLLVSLVEDRKALIEIECNRGRIRA
jgi:hypothetical protein